MRFVRPHVRQGSWLALAALAINLALSFGHVHLQQIAHAPVAKLAVVAGQTTPAGDDGGNRADDLCAICLAAAAIGSAVAATAPVLPTVLAVAIADQDVAAEIVIAPTPRSAFWSRGPPLA